MRMRVAVVAIIVCATLSSLRPGACQGGRRRRGRPPCPSAECRCRWVGGGGGGGNRRPDIRVNCIGTSEGVPNFRRTDTIYGSLIMAARNITRIPSDAFAQIRTRSLDLSDNRLGDGTGFDGDVDGDEPIGAEAFRGLERHLRGLSLTENALSAVPVVGIAPLSELRSLRLERNNISRLDARTFVNNTELRELYLYENRIRDIDPEAFRGLDKLEHLKLMSNELGHIPTGVFRNLRRLASLDLSKNLIHELPADTFRGLYRLNWLELQANRIRKLSRTAFRGLRRLRHLKIEANPLRDVDRKTFRPIRKLRYLSMDVVYAERLSPRIFRGLSRLTMLNLGDADSDSLPAGLLTPLRALRFMTVFNATGRFDGLSHRLFDPEQDVSRLNVFVAPLRSCKCNVSWINALTSRGVWIRGHCGSRGRHQRRLSCLVPGRRKAVQKTRSADGG